MPQKVTGYISNLDWANLQRGCGCSIRIFKDTDLHYEFGDQPYEYVVRVEITAADLGRGSNLPLAEQS